jgi:diacylglycerol kinase (ATP)
LVAACSVVTQGHTREVDVGLANEETYFFEAAGTGLDATLFPIGEEIKGGRWSRIFSAVKLAMQYRVQPIEITLDRPVRDALAKGAPTRLPKRMLDMKTIRRNAVLVVVANGPYYGGGFTVAPGARLSDGRLTVSIYRHFSKLELARHFWSISRGHYRYSAKIETLHSAEVRLDSPARLPVHTDGVPFGKLPVTLRCVPRALRVFAPERPFSGRDENPPVALPAEQRKPQIHSKEHAR